LCGVMRWAAGLLYAPRGDEEAGGGPRGRHIISVAEGTPRRNRPLHSCFTPLDIDDGLRDVGVRVTVLVQRAACECSDAWRCCQLPDNALALPLDILVVQLRSTYIHTHTHTNTHTHTHTHTHVYIYINVFTPAFFIYMHMLYSFFTPALYIICIHIMSRL
jgi:hypothetical protein